MKRSLDRLSFDCNMSSSATNTSNTVAAAISALQQSRVLFIQVWSCALFGFGIIGHALSIYVFTRRSLRSNPCSQYFLVSAICGVVVVCINVPLRLFQLGYNINAFVSSDAMCRILTWMLLWFKYETYLYKIYRIFSVSF